LLEALGLVLPLLGAITIRHTESECLSQVLKRS
jgi:hypothetical protein